MESAAGKVAAPEAQPESFKFTQKVLEEVREIIARYPEGRQASAVMPLLMLAQRECGNWLPKAAMDTVAELLDMPPMRVYEVATFYSMYNLHPMGKYHVQLCTTTPCWLRGSEAVVKACEQHLGITLGETTADGMFTLSEVECLGACVNAPMCQVKSSEHDAFYEDLNEENVVALLRDLAEGRRMKAGSRIGRHSSEPAGGVTTLKHMVKG
ncbi:MAG: NADH-quinone oxidoreductase subunit NuoE [Alphaproteobacteria bacterium]|nr:MAG: NADH-quinone oxidoreductase subunit NuoE [Alphaproteobacteria bacterium]TAE83380.1 MAG: NADH-quinone oxidoreductase subunit NuoE [Alphaproteobacteria bacterium]TAF14677.1 MAG: NADH-quinone oxidoreductase subunit NuoE [Alphaproteobacteria bacterium]TAF41260.1 MAG: NADH-quinone oxidoreductase subunit NuoE [Alphaproteobacteria bacterium]TAF75773.1 MAG: NADH-quinone oxidoreductase subunit NuoE [Alphaproteobacteria bacterium]